MQTDDMATIRNSHGIR